MKLATILLDKFSEFIAVRMGLFFPEERRADIERGIIAAAKDLGCSDPASCVEKLLTSPLTKEEVEILACHLTVGETYFFREPKSFKILEEEVLPQLIRARQEERRIRIWSAGCATGEEPYSLAMLLARILPDWQNWKIMILATDINPRFLGKADRGVYSEWSFRETPAWLKERYFRKGKDGRFELLPRLREMVTFSYLNLADDSYPSLTNNTNAMDLIFCRNVLMYFAEDIKTRVIGNLNRCLVGGGWLITGSCDAPQSLPAELAAAAFPGATFYRRLSQKEMQDKALSSPAALPGRSPSLSPGFTRPEAFVDPGREKVAETAPDRGKTDSSVLPRAAAEGYAEAFSLYGQGGYSEAEAKLLDLLQSGLEDPQAMALLARVYANKGQLAEACQWSEKAVATDRINPAHHYLLATIMEEQGRTEEAVRTLKQALYLDPDFVIAYFSLGSLARRQGRIKEEEKYFRNALDLLSRQGTDEIVAGSDGLTAGRLEEIIRTLTRKKDEAKTP